MNNIQVYQLLYAAISNKTSSIANVYYPSDQRDPNSLPQIVVNMVSDSNTSLSKLLNNGNTMFYCDIFTLRSDLLTALELADYIKEAAVNTGLQFLDNITINNIGIDTSTPTAMNHLAVTMTVTNQLRRV